MTPSTDENEALRILGLEKECREEELLDAYEAKCFEVRQKMLNLIPVPRVMRKRYEELERYGAAYAALKGEKEEMSSVPSFRTLLPFEEATELLGAPPPWSFCLRVYERKMSAARLKIANAFSAPALAEGIREVLPLQQAWHSLLHRSFVESLQDEELFGPLIDREVKATQAAYTGQILLDLERLEEKGLGRSGVEGAIGEMERIARNDREGVKGELKRVLTEVQRIDRMHRSEEGKTL